METSREVNIIHIKTHIADIIIINFNFAEHRISRIIVEYIDSGQNILLKAFYSIPKVFPRSRRFPDSEVTPPPSSRSPSRYNLELTRAMPK